MYLFLCGNFFSIDTAGFVDVCKRRVWQKVFFLLGVCIKFFTYGVEVYLTKSVCVLIGICR